MNFLEPCNRFRCKLQFNRLRDDILAGNIPLPSKATIELTMRCNLNCLMCFRDRDQKGELAFSDIKKVIDNIPSSIEEIHLIGGEVFLRKDLFEILDHLNNRNYKVRIQTNGTLLDDERIKKISGYKNLLGLGFSIDGTRELHNRIRGVDSAFDKTIEAIKKTSERFPVSVNTVLLEENFREIEDVFKTIKGLGIREYRLEPEMFCTEEEIKDTGIGPIAANVKQSGRYSFTAKDLIDLKKRLDVLASGSGIRVVIAPRVAELDAKEFIAGNIREKKRLFCKHLLVPRIDSEGNLVFCHIIRKVFGDVKGKKLDELWGSEELKDFRKKLLKNNLYPVCKRCCRLRSI